MKYLNKLKIYFIIELTILILFSATIDNLNNIKVYFMTSNTIMSGEYLDKILSVSLRIREI